MYSIDTIQYHTIQYNTSFQSHSAHSYFQLHGSSSFKYSSASTVSIPYCLSVRSGHILHKWSGRGRKCPWYVVWMHVCMCFAHLKFSFYNWRFAKSARKNNNSCHTIPWIAFEQKVQDEDPLSRQKLNKQQWDELSSSQAQSMQPTLSTIAPSVGG